MSSSSSIKRKGAMLTVSSAQKTKHEPPLKESNKEKENLFRPPRPSVTTSSKSRGSRSDATFQSAIQEANPKVSRLSSNVSDWTSDSGRRSLPGKENQESSKLAEDSDREILRANQNRKSSLPTHPVMKGTSFQHRQNDDDSENLKRLLADSLRETVPPIEKHTLVQSRNDKAKKTHNRSSLDQYDEINKILHSIQSEHEQALQEEVSVIIQEHESAEQDVLNYLHNVRDSLMLQKQQALPEYRNLLAALKNAKAAIEQSKHNFEIRIAELEKAKSDKSIEDRFERIVRDLKKEVMNPPEKRRK